MALSPAQTTTPFWPENRQTWVDASDLKAGETLRDPSSQSQQIGLIRHRSVLQPAYNLTVEDLHTYYVMVGATPALVHNSKPLCDNWDVPSAKELDATWERLGVPTRTALSKVARGGKSLENAAILEHRSRHGQWPNSDWPRQLP
ncbi:polymorphic toxin-type HINT domain-containing protein [Kitasatospora sp. NPDC098663]|uniref:polymorphic toxin-type HINT domain-containing protein n=1 Tax=Kitasatospora sp. NPDC098663 TaxID=3364096 RepID=UPI00382A2C65